MNIDLTSDYEKTKIELSETKSELKKTKLTKKLFLTNERNIGGG